MTSVDFLKSFPEFRAASADLLTAKLTEATLIIDAALYGDKTQLAIGFNTARLLALSPLGVAAKMVSKMGATAYDEMCNRLRISAALLAGRST